MIYKIRCYISNKAKGFLIALLVTKSRKFTLLNSKLVVENSNQTKTLVLGKTGKLDLQLSAISHAYKLDHDGRYHEAATIRSELLKGIYQDAKAGPEYFPPLLGERWTKYVGHLAVLALHSKAQELGMVPKGKRILLTSDTVANQKLCELLGENYVQLSDSYLANLEFFPPTQVLFENFHSIKTSNGFMETHQFIENVFLENSKQNPGKEILSHKNVENSIDGLAKEKFIRKMNKPFIAVHLRNTGNRERRDVDPVTYFDAFSELNARGYLLVNIGPEVQSKPGLEILNISDRELHPYIMMKAKFAITSTSGPSLLPSLFGTPNLVTNVTSIGRNMINCNSSTFYLPKSVYLKGEQLKLREILKLDVAYDERERSELKKIDVTIQENSISEIRDAVNWMIDSVEDKDFSRDGQVLSKVNSVQKNQKAISRGRLIPTYIKSNPDYLN